MTTEQKIEDSPFTVAECSICLANLQETPFGASQRSQRGAEQDNGDPSQVVAVLKCGHVFHLTCIAQQLEMGRGNCPLCRQRYNLADDRSTILGSCGITLNLEPATEWKETHVAAQQHTPHNTTADELNSPLLKALARKKRQYRTRIHVATADVKKKISRLEKEFRNNTKKKNEMSSDIVELSEYLKFCEVREAALATANSNSSRRPGAPETAPSASPVDVDQARRYAAMQVRRVRELHKEEANLVKQLQELDAEEDEVAREVVQLKVSVRHRATGGTGRKRPRSDDPAEAEDVAENEENQPQAVLPPGTRVPASRPVSSATGAVRQQAPSAAVANQNARSARDRGNKGAAVEAWLKEL